MKLREFLNQLYDETLVKIEVSKGKKFDLWMADYIGWYEPVMKKVRPYLDRDIVDEVYTTIEKNPECEDEDDEDAMCGVIHVELCSAKDSKRRADSEILEDLIVAMREYDNLRDREWDFETEHGNRDMWGDDVCDEHDELMEDIDKARAKVSKLIAEATGDKDAHL